MKDTTFLVVRHRWVLNLLASKNPWTVHLFMVPLIGFWGFIALIQYTRPSLSQLAMSMTLGFLYWTLNEYLIHRFYFHFKSKIRSIQNFVESFHIYHHKTPTDMAVINSGWLTAYLGSAFHFSVIWLLSFGNTSLAIWILIGTMITYIYYEWIHYLVHDQEFKSGFMRYLQEFHLTHHLSPTKNYGQISPIWDWFFGTLIKNKSVASNAVMRSFVRTLRERV